MSGGALSSYQFFLLPKSTGVTQGSQVEAVHPVSLYHSWITPSSGNLNLFFNGMQANLPDICLGRRHYLIVLGNKENMSFALEGNTTSVFQGYSSINNYKKIARSSVLKMCEMQVIHGKFSWDLAKRIQTRGTGQLTVIAPVLASEHLLIQ